MTKDPAYRGFSPAEDNEPLGADLDAAVAKIRGLLGGSADLILTLHEHAGVRYALMMFDGLFSNHQVSDLLLRALSALPPGADTPEKLRRFLAREALVSCEPGTLSTYGELYTRTMSGFAALLIDGVPGALSYGYTNYATRGVGEPATEVNLRGSREGFSESLNQNTALVRRRIKSPMLSAEAATIGRVSRTGARVFYIKGVADDALVASVKRRLEQAQMGVLLDTGYLQPFLESGLPSLFSGVGSTERPDTLCAKLIEGRVAVMVDGSPFAVYVPCLFAEHFQSLDDYTRRAFFAAFVRTVKFLAFFVAVLLPGVYVAAATFHPELLRASLLGLTVSSVARTPLAPLPEALVVFVLFELLREAGLRLPRAVGHTVSVVGGIVIGDAAVEAGLIGLPMMIVIAVTAVASFVVPSLYEPVTILRFLFILAGGTLGLPGVSAAFVLMVTDLCALDSMGVPASAPLSPTVPGAFRDLLLRAGWRRLQEPTYAVGRTPGSEEDEDG